MRTLIAIAVALALTACAEPTEYAGADIDLAVYEKAPERTTIADIASGSEDFEILTAALDAADLVDTFDGRRQYTVFAPTDDAFLDAFDALGIAPADLLADTDTLTTILTYHVATGRRYAEDVLDSHQIRTIGGEFAEISSDDSGAYIDDAMIVLPDVEADNGIIHVIDAVLLPPSL